LNQDFQPVRLFVRRAVRERISALAFLLATAVLVVPLGSASEQLTALTFRPVADAFVTSQEPYGNYGSSTKLTVSTAPVQRTYLRFNVEGLTAPVTRATLRLYTNNSAGGQDGVFFVPDSGWSERGIIYSNAPALSQGPVGFVEAMESGRWTMVDLTSLITGNGTFSLAVSDGGSATFLSRESGSASAPQLVVETAPASAPPSAISPPTIAGTPQEGAPLTAGPGTWSGTQPISYAHKWRRCDQGGACADISGATGTTHTLTRADVGSTISVSVTASNGAGTSSASSLATAVIAAPPVAPSNISPPTIAGSAEEGQTLGAEVGAWSGTEPMSYTYQWSRCGLRYSDAVRADTPLAYWRLGEPRGLTAADVSGSGRDAVYAGGTSLGNPGALPGSSDTAAGLDGTDDHVMLNPASGFPASALTVELWLKTSDTTKRGTAFSYATAASDNEVQLRDYRNFVIYRGPTKITTRVSANDGAWHDIVFTWRASDGQVQLFKDGELAFTGTIAPGTSIPGSGAIVWGQDQDVVGGGFDRTQAFLGHLDEVAVYPSVLSDARIQTHYSAGPDASCDDISGATGQSYLLSRADVSGSIQLAVTASNTAGSSTEASAQTALVVAATPPPPPPPPPPPLPPGSPEPLTWAPPVLINPITIRISSPTRDLNLDSTRDYLLEMPSTAVRPGPSGGLWIQGGHNIVLIGGEFDFTGVVNTSPTEVEGRLMTYSGVTGTIHIEGLYAQGDGLVEGIQTFSNSPAVLQLENCRFERLHTTANALHSDLIQWDGSTNLRVDRFTGASEYQGFFRTNDVGTAIFKHVNLRGASGSNDPSPRLLWQGGSYLPMVLEDFYVEPRPGQALGITVWPGRDHPDSSVRPTVQSDGSLAWPTRTGITGTAIPGGPAGGDFVPVGLAGTSYVSPGYR